MTVIISGGIMQEVRPSGGGFPLPISEALAVHRGGSGSIPLIGLIKHVTYEGMYRTQPWVQAVVNKLVYALARLPLKTYEVDGNDDRQLDRSSGLAQLMRKPWPRARGWHFKVALGWSLFVHGHALFLKGRPGEGQPPDSVWPVPWPLVQTVEDERGIIGYVVNLMSGSYSLAPDDVIHYELVGGGSPLEPLRASLRIEEASQRWQEKLFENSAVPRGAFVTESKIRDEAMPRLRAELEQMYGGVENAGRFGIFDQGLKWQAISASAVDAELVNQRKLAREEVCGVYDVAPPLVGILEKATFNSTEALHEALYVDTLGARMVLIEETTAAHLIDPEPSWDGRFVEFDTKAVLRPTPEARYRSYLMGQQSSTNSVNERRREENLPPIDHPLADAVMMPTNMVALGPDGLTLPTGVDEGGGVPAEGAVSDVVAVDAAALTLEAYRAGLGDNGPSLDPEEG